MSKTNTPSQHWQAQAYADNARFAADYGVSLLDWLQAGKGERILDLGCGDGVLTQKIAATGAQVLGLDGSADLAAAAQRLGIHAVQGDGQQLAFEHEFDAVFSNAALHWMTDAQAVVQGVAKALKPGGRFVAEMGGSGNIAAIQTALQQALGARDLQARPCWYFPDADTYAALLMQNGFTVQKIMLFARPTPLPGGVAGWLATFAEPMLPAGLVPALQAQVLNEAAIAAEQYLPRDKQGAVLADYVRLRFAAVKATPGAV